ncbi:MAG: CHAT domain-containing protein [Cyclobacteriaceae bacterium]
MSHVLHAQPDLSKNAKQHVQTGDSLLRLARFDLALEQFRFAEEKNNKDSLEFYVKIQSRIGQALGRLSRFKESAEVTLSAAEFIEQNGLEDSKSAIEIYQNLGILNLMTGQFELSLKYSKKCLSLVKRFLGETDLLAAHTYNNLSLAYYQLGELTNSINSLEKSMEIKKEYFGINHYSMADGYHNLCNYYMQKGWYREAIDNIKRAIEVRESQLQQHDPKLAKTYSVAGHAYSKNNEFELADKMFNKSWSLLKNGPYAESFHAIEVGIEFSAFLIRKGALDDALEVLNESLSINQKQFDKQIPFEARILFAKGRINLRKGNFDNAERDLNAAFDLTSQLDQNLTLSNILLEFGALYKAKGESDLAHRFYKEAAEKYRKINGDAHSGLSKAYYGMCMTADSREDSLLYIDKSLSANILVVRDSIDFEDRSIILDHPFYLESLIAKAKILSDESPQFSLKSLYQADSIVGHLRSRLFLLEDKLRFGEASKEVYDLAIELSTKLYQDSGNEDYFNQAFHFLSRSKGEILRSSVSQVEARSYIGISDSLLTYEKQLLSDLNYLKSRRFNEEYSVSLIREMDSIEIELVRLVGVFEENYPDYHQHKYQNKTINLNSYLNNLKAGTGTIAYHLSEEKIYIFYLSNKRSEVVVKERSGNLKVLIDNLHASLMKSEPESFNKSAFELYRMLIEPVSLPSLDLDLTIIPADLTWNIPFDLLTKETVSLQSFKELNYLLKTNSFTYNYTFETNELPNPGFTERKEQLIGFAFSKEQEFPVTGNTDYSKFRNEALSELPGTGVELKNISRVFEGSFFYGSESKESVFKNLGPKHEIIHLALHGIMDDENPDNSRLIFQKNVDSLDDNVLFSHELYNLNLNADLIVLSACQSGAGQVATGEGLMSLGYAFSYAGSKNILLSKWDVADEVSPVIITSFYKNLNEGLSLNESIRNAKLDFLSQSDNISSNPLYWGSYYVLGQSQYVVRKRGLQPLHYVLIFGFLAVIALSWKRKFFSKSP